MEQTDLELVKKTAVEFLYIEPEINKNVPFFLIHPFFENRTFFIPGNESEESVFVDILESDDNLKTARDFIESKINSAETPFHIFYMMRNADKRTFLKFVMNYLSKKDFSEILNFVWISTEFPHFDINVSVPEFKKMFKMADKKYIMDENEVKKLDEMPEEIIIYRGITSDKYYKALSWTLNKDKARWFSTRFDSNGHVFQAKVKKQDVLAYFDNAEQEVVVDYNKIYDLNEC